MKKKIKILHLEDVATDAELIARELIKAKIDPEILVVPDKARFVKALRDYTPDIILSDHSLASFNSHEAIKLVKDAGINVPFILVTAAMSDEFAAKVMKEGAYDYILKDRLNRLPSAILNSIEKQRLEDAQHIAHEKLVFLIGNTPLGFIEWDNQLRVKSLSKRAEEIFGWNLKDYIKNKRTGYDLIYEEDLDRVTKVVNALINGDAERNTIQFRNYTKDGKVIWCEWFNAAMKSDKGITIMSLIQDVTESSLANLERMKLVNDLKQRNTELEQFAYIISHNLRAPVANIIGASSVLNSVELDKGDLEFLMDGINKSVMKLDDVVKDLNHILQVKGEINDTKEIVHFTDLVEDIKTSIKNLIDKDGIEIKYDFSEANELLTLKSYLYSIFYNLISNSIKYRQQQIPCIIEIKSRLKENNITLTFADNGMGIDLRKKGKQLFGLYKRFHTNIEGKGMGLYMVKTQVEALGGKISVRSAEKKGTKFTIEFEI